VSSGATEVITVIKSICVDAVTVYFTREIPKLLERCALCRNYDDDCHLIGYQESHGDFAQPCECCADSYGMLARSKMWPLVAYRA
jgi:hypothetical protein